MISDQLRADIYQYCQTQIPISDDDYQCQFVSRLDIYKMNQFFGFPHQYNDFMIKMEHIPMVFEGMKDVKDNYYNACIPIEEMEFTTGKTIVMQWRLAVDY